MRRRRSALAHASGWYAGRHTLREWLGGCRVSGWFSQKCRPTASFCHRPNGFVSPTPNGFISPSPKRLRFSAARDSVTAALGKHPTRAIRALRPRHRTTDNGQLTTDTAHEVRGNTLAVTPVTALQAKDLRRDSRMTAENRASTFSPNRQRALALRRDGGIIGTWRSGDGDESSSAGPAEGKG
jgi:hypothetical protein